MLLPQRWLLAGSALRERIRPLLAQRFHKPAMGRQDAGATNAASALEASAFTGAAISRLEAGATRKALALAACYPVCQR